MSKSKPTSDSRLRQKWHRSLDSLCIKEKENNCGSPTRHILAVSTSEGNQFPMIQNNPSSRCLTNNRKTERSWSLPDQENSLYAFLARKSSSCNTNRATLVSSSNKKPSVDHEGKGDGLTLSSMSEKEKSVLGPSLTRQRKKGFQVIAPNTTTLSSLKENLESQQETSVDVTSRIRYFMSKPNPPRPPSSLKIPKVIGYCEKKIAKDVIVSNTKVKESDSEALDGLGDAEEPVNTDTCPNSTFHPNRSSWYYGARRGKCRYLRIPESPIPPIWSVFEINNDDIMSKQ